MIHLAEFSDTDISRLLKDKEMIKRKYIITAIAVLCAVCAVLTSCSKGNKFEAIGEKYVDKKTNVAYMYAPGCYTPTGIDKDTVYGSIGDIKLYKIVGSDPTRWLCDASGTVFYADTETLPTLDKMNVAEVTLTMEGAELDSFTSSEDIDLLRDAYLDGESIRKPYLSENSYKINWRVNFVDRSRGICYTVSYFVLNEEYVSQTEDGAEINYGDRFFYNRYEERFTPAGDVLDKYVDEYLELTD